MSRRILSFALFEAKIGLTPEQEAFLNKYTEGTWTYHSSTGLVDVKGRFDCSHHYLEDFVGVKFGKISGSFSCSYNKLTSREGAPQEVGGDFDCEGNKLTSLEGAPQKVGKSFDCFDNKLTSLEGAPQKVGKDFNCPKNNLTSLKGAPQVVSGDFKCYQNNLKNLAGAPQEVGGDLDCSVNTLTSLAGAPQEVGGKLTCYNNKLTSLEGAPQVVGGDFWCNEFKLTEGEWNPKGWLKVLKHGSPEAQNLVLTLLPAEALNKEIAKDPAGMIMKLKPIWNDRFFKKTRAKLVWPKGYSDDADLVGDLDDVGF